MALGSRRPRGIADWLLLGATLVPASLAAVGLVRAPLVAGQASPPTGGFAGHYQASAAVIRSDVSAWGDECGVKPQSYTAGERPLVEVTSLGAHLALGYPERKLRTDRCWSPNPVARLTSATAADNRWRAECRTPRGEAKQEVGTYTVMATGPYTLELVEESNYDWQLKTSRCVARVRILQQLERVPKERAAEGGKPDAKLKAATATTKGVAPPVAAVAPVEPVAPCVPGPVTRLRIRPNDARIEPGQRACFSLQGIDAEGCASEVEPGSVRWELKKPDAARAQLGDGCFRAASSAADAEGTFRVTAIREGLRAEASVSVVAPDLSDITVRRGTTAPSESAPAPIPAPARSVSDAGVQAAAVKPRDLTTFWITLAGALSLLSVGLVVALKLRKKPAPAARRSSLPVPAIRDVVALPPMAPRAEPAVDRAGPGVGSPALTAGDTGTPGAQAPAIAPPPPSTEPMICPKCRRGYAPGAIVCEGDGSALVAYAEFVRRAKEAEATSMAACPGCGVKVAAGSVFCGGCGTRLSS